MIPYVCRSCRSRLYSQIRYRSQVNGRQWLSQTAFLFQNGQEESVRHAPKNNRTQRAFQEDEPWLQDSRAGPTQPLSSTGRYSSRALRPQELLNELGVQPRGGNTNWTPLNVTEEVDGDSGHVDGASSSNKRASIPRELRKLRNAVIHAADTEYLNDRQVADVWTAFLEAAPTLLNHEAFEALSGNQTFRRRLRWLSKRIFKAWQHSFASTLRAESQDAIDVPPLPRLTLDQMLRVHAAFEDDWRIVAWQGIWIMVRDMLEYWALDPERVLKSGDFGKDCVHQLMSIWNLLMARELQRTQAGRTSLDQAWLDQIMQPSSLDWTFLPEPGEEIRHTLQDALSPITGTLTREGIQQTDLMWNENRFDTVPATILTLDLLRMVERQPGGGEMVLPYQPWMRLMGGIIHRAAHKPVPRILSRKLSQENLEPAMRDYYQSLIGRFRLHQDEQVTAATVKMSTDSSAQVGAHQGISGTNKPSSDDDDFQPSSQAPKSTNSVALRDRFTYLSIGRLEAATAHQDTSAAGRVRQDVFRFNSQHPEIQLPVQIYEHLLLTFLRLRRIDIAIDCWKSMIQAGHAPTVKTYGIAIRHSQYLKGKDAVEYFWGQMRKERLQPDGHVWTARVLSLFRRGEVQHGMQTLKEMGHEWINAVLKAHGHRLSFKPTTTKGLSSSQVGEVVRLADGDVNGVPKPSQPVLNAAIGALNATKQDRMMTEVIAWSRQFGIEPDVTTYNHLISMTFRNGRPTEAMNMLRRMRERNIEANEDTWTVLLVAMFNDASINNLSPKEQENKILDLIKGIEAGSGASLGAKGYAVFLDRLLKDLNNPRAAQSVLQHMASIGMELTQYHHTILMTAFFQQQPPDFASIEALWNRINKGTKGYSAALGVVFYDRMIEGYAKHHHAVGIAPMMSFVSQAQAQGKLISWTAWSCVVRALAERRDWHTLSKIVSDIRQGLRERGVGAVAGTGQRDFWELVIATGVLNDEGITRPEQILLDNMGRRQNQPAGTRSRTSDFAERMSGPPRSRDI